MTEFSNATLLTSAAAILLSIFNTYWLHFRKGKAKATIPSQFSLKPHRDQNSTASIAIQTLIFGTGVKKLVLDRVYCILVRAGVSQSFSTWQTATSNNAHQRRGGLVVDEQGVDEAFMFFVTPGTEEFKFTAGEYQLKLFVKTAGQKNERTIFDTKFTLIQKDIDLLTNSGAVQFFRHPTADRFIKLHHGSDGKMNRADQ